MRKSILRKLLLLVPIVVLGLTLLFVNFAVQTFGDTAYTFVYNTNVQTVQSFADELTALSEQGISSAQFRELYTNMIYNFNNEVGDKDAIVTFLLDEAKQAHHSNGYNKEYLESMLQDEANMSLVTAAYESRSSGEITLAREGGPQTMYYHRFYSGPSEYSLFLCVEREAINRQLNANGVIIPLCVVGLLLLFALEYIIWLKLLCVHCGACARGSEPAEKTPVPAKAVPAGSESVASEPVASLQAASAPGASAPEASAPDASVPEASAPDASVPAASVQAARMPAGNTFVGGTFIGGTFTGGMFTGGTFTRGTFAGDTSKGDAPAGDAPAGDTSKGDTPAGDTPAGDAPAGDAPAGSAPEGSEPEGSEPIGD